jgi:peptidyl-prolyl cis-trans isomerase C
MQPVGGAARCGLADVHFRRKEKMLGPIPALFLLLGAAPFPAVVNGRPITEPEVAKAVRDHVRKTSFHRELTAEQFRVERERALAALVEEELRAQEARRRGLAVAREPLEKLAAAEEASAGGSQQFDAILAANGIDRARYLEVIERTALASRLVEVETARLPEPTRDEAVAHYRANRSRYVVGASAHVQELCVRVDPSSGPDGWKEAEGSAAELRSRLVAGADFGGAARDAKCDQFAEKGGDLGFVHAGSLESGLDQAIWALRDGEISQPVRSLRGWHLIRRVETRPERPVPFPEVDQAIRAELREARRSAAVKRLDAALRARAKVVLAGEG